MYTQLQECNRPFVFATLPSIISRQSINLLKRTLLSYLDIACGMGIRSLLPWPSRRGPTSENGSKFGSSSSLLINEAWSQAENPIKTLSMRAIVLLLWFCIVFLIWDCRPEPEVRQMPLESDTALLERRDELLRRCWRSVIGKAESFYATPLCPEVTRWDQDEFEARNHQNLAILWLDTKEKPAIERWFGYTALDVGIIVDSTRLAVSDVPKKYARYARFVVPSGTQPSFRKKSYLFAVARALIGKDLRDYQYIWVPEHFEGMRVATVVQMFEVANVMQAELAQLTTLKTGEKLKLYFKKQLNSENPLIRGDTFRALRFFVEHFRESMVSPCDLQVALPRLLGLKSPAVLDIKMESLLVESTSKDLILHKACELDSEIPLREDGPSFEKRVVARRPWCAVPKRSVSELQLPWPFAFEPQWRTRQKLNEIRWKTLIIVQTDRDVSSRLMHWHGYSVYHICVIYTGSSVDIFNKLQASSRFALRKQGSKFQTGEWALKHIQQWDRDYEYVWFVDAEINLNATQLRTLVNAASRMNAAIAHPTCERGRCNQFGIKAEPSEGLSLRFVNRVPLVAPLIRSDALAYILPTLACADEESTPSLWWQLLRSPTTILVDSVVANFDGPASRHPQKSESCTLQVYGCDFSIPFKTFRSMTRLAFQMHIRQSDDIDWCAGRSGHSFKNYVLEQKNGTSFNRTRYAEFENRVLGIMALDPTEPPLKWSSQRLSAVKGRYLIIVVAGDSSLHRVWADDPRFDLCVMYFGNSKSHFKQLKRESTYAIAMKGMKWQLIRNALKSIPWKNYEYIWLPDDDIQMEPNKVFKMFQLAHLYDIRLGQPALHNFGLHYPYHAVNKHWAVHFTNFVEIMVPFLRVDIMEYLFPLFDKDEVESGYGLDSLWPQLSRNMRLGVIDATPCNHTGGRIMGGRANSFYSKLKVDPFTEQWRTTLPYDCMLLWNVTTLFGHVTVEKHNQRYPELPLQVLTQRPRRQAQPRNRTIILPPIK